jgi:tRNA(fMet)-specific endonuclease VapC
MPVGTIYLPDTNIFIALLRGQPQVVERFKQVPLSHLRLSQTVLGELEYGAEKSAHVVRNRARLVELSQRIALAEFSSDTARTYGAIRATLERNGQAIGPNDLWIAAQALTSNAILVTDNTREFMRVAGLELENWLVHSS